MILPLTVTGEKINFDVKVIHGYRRFCNKIYQATKYVLGKLDKNFVPLPDAGRSGKEVLAEKWILHKFAQASKQINEALTTRDFGAATTIAYHYFYTQLCDVYIENSKALIAEGAPEVQLSATNTLYTVLEGGLKMLHPFMPFLTEELWQRLPRRPQDSTPSIMLASYPTYDSSLGDPTSEEAYELVLDVSKAIRSLTGEYGIKENGVLYVQLFDSTAYQTCAQQIQSIRSLVGKGVSEIHLLRASEPKPQGCIPEPVSAAATAFLHIKGRVDLDQEIVKARIKMEKASEVVKKQKSLLNDEAFASKVREELQELERTKLADAEKEVEEMQGSMQRLEALKLE
jgi:valyl-tRNA synthetase